MSERTTEVQVTFLHPFSLAGVDGEQPAGTYTVETQEVSIDSLSFAAYRRVATTIVLPSRQYGYAAKQVVTIDPHDLDAAKARDAAAIPSPPAGARDEDSRGSIR